MPVRKGKYGWKKDREDNRDFLLSVEHLPTILPPAVDLRSAMPEVYDQGDLGSCTANAIAGALEYEMRKQNEPDMMPARLFIYYNEREMEGTVNDDAGAEIRDGVKSVHVQGVCDENLWPYDVTAFTVAPNQTARTAALLHRSLVYHRVPQTIRSIKGSLSMGFPVIFGFQVFESFEDEAVASTGVLNMPTSKEENVGGHAVMAVGYRDDVQRILVRNSWGPDWGMAGYFTMPYAYILDHKLANDLWQIRKLT